MKMKDRTYDRLKWTVTRGIPGLIGFVSTVGVVMGYPEQTKATVQVLGALSVMLSTWIGLSSYDQGGGT